MTSIKAAFFEGETPVMLIKGTIAQLNSNTSPTRVWRQIDASVKKLADVPPIESLSVHPDHVQREV